MSELLNSYISFRYPNWLDYAAHQCRVQGLEGWESDLMNDMVEDILKKPEQKMLDMLGRTTRKIVNGQPTTELDKFVLKMLQINARSKFASFRKNTVGQKIIRTMGKTVEVAQFTELGAETDPIDQGSYNADRADRMDQMHRGAIILLNEFGYSREVLRIYISHFMEATPAHTHREKLIIEKIQTFLKENSIKLQITKVTVVNCQITVDSIEELKATKEKVATELNVKMGDIHFNYDEVEE